MTYYLRSQIAKLANIHVETLRFYEQNGLIPHPERDKNGYRIYTDQVLRRLEFINKVKECGLTIPEIRRFLRLLDSGGIDNTELSAYIRRKVGEIETKIEKLTATKNILVAFNNDLEKGEISPHFQQLFDQIKIN